MIKRALSYLVAIAAAIGIAGCDMTNNQETIAQGRATMLAQFTASEKWIVFPIPLDREVAALAVINRETGHRMLISSGRRFLLYPQFSADGKRLLVVRGDPSTGHGQLLSCTIADWRCRVFVHDALQIRWPIEIRKDVVLYAAGQPFADGKRVHYDLYLAEPQSQPVQLSTFALYNLEALSVSGDKIMFSAVGSISPDNVLFPKPLSPSAPSSNIWMLRADWKEKRLIIPGRQLERLYVMDMQSSSPAMSEDGTHVAFLNGRSPPGQSRYRYNLVVVTIDGMVQKYVEATTPRPSSRVFWGFSKPAFAGSSVLVNQLFDDRYETTLVDLGNNSIRPIASFGHTGSALDALDRREMHIAE